MKDKFQKENIQILTSILQKKLLGEFPSVPVIEVRCAVHKDELMILTQHPPGIAVDSKKIFTILKESLQRESQYHDEKVQFYVRVSGKKLPYAKHSITIKTKEIDKYQQIPSQETSNRFNNNGAKNRLIFPPVEIPDLVSSVKDNHISDDPFTSPTDNLSDHPFNSQTEENIADSTLSADISFGSDNSLNSHTIVRLETSSSSDATSKSNSSLFDPSENESEEQENFDPFVGAENPPKRKRQPISLPPLPILLGGVLGITVIFGGGAFFLNRACVIGKCEELEVAQEFKSQSFQFIREAKSPQELIALQQKLDKVISDLKVIPQWSPRYQQAQEMTSSFSDQSTKINLVIKALQAASAAEQKSQTPYTSLDELRSRQALWQQVILPLKAIKSNHELYILVQAKLPKYQSNLESINQQLLNEESWQKKLTTAKNVADSAKQRQATAKSGNDWQGVQTAWQEVINDLKSIPPSTTAHEEAKKLLAEYQPKLILASNRATMEIAAASTFKQATNFANQARGYEAKNQWQLAIASWQKAIQTAKQVSQDISIYNQAHSLVKTYSIALEQTVEKQQLYGKLEQSRIDLRKTCFNVIQFCNFTIEEQPQMRIVVRLTPEYDKRLITANDGLWKHFQTLQQALGVISENANIPLFLYNSQGQERYIKNPQ